MKILVTVTAGFIGNAVINLAAQPGVRYSLENPHAYIDDIVEGVVRALDRPTAAIVGASHARERPHRGHGPLLHSHQKFEVVAERCG